MSTTEQTREYLVDRVVLYDHLTEPATWPTYENGLLEVLPFDRFVEVGDTVGVRFRILGTATPAVVTLLDRQRGERFHLRAQVRGLPAVEHDWIFEDTDRGTRVRVTLKAPEVASWQGRNIAAYLLPRQFERDLARSLDNIEDLVALGLAARTPTPAHQARPHPPPSPRTPILRTTEHLLRNGAAPP
jgi:hypothetical protein